MDQKRQTTLHWRFVPVAFGRTDQSQTSLCQIGPVDRLSGIRDALRRILSIEDRMSGQFAALDSGATSVGS